MHRIALNANGETDVAVVLSLRNEIDLYVNVI